VNTIRNELKLNAIMGIVHLPCYYRYVHINDRKFKTTNKNRERLEVGVNKKKTTYNYRKSSRKL